MVGFRQLLFVALAATSVIAVDYSTVLNDLTTCDNTTKQITTSTNAYTGSGSQTLQLRAQIVTLEKNVNQTSTDVDASSVPTAAQGQTVLDYINNTLLPDTKTAMTAAKNKKQTFVNAGLKNEMVSNLKTLQNITDILANKLIAKAPTSSLKSGGQTAKNNIDAAFTDAINYLSS